MFLRQPVITPIEFTQLVWSLADIPGLIRDADKKGHDLKTPLGQFKILEGLVGTTASMACFHISVILKVHSSDWRMVQCHFQGVHTITLDEQVENGADMLFILISGTVRDWYHLDFCKDPDIRIIMGLFKETIAPAKIWGHILKCNSVY